MKKLMAILFLSSPLLFAVEELSDASPEVIEENYQKALAAYQNRQYNESLDHIRHVIKSSMLNYKLRMLAAHNHWRLGNAIPAEQHFRTAIEGKPEELGARIDLSLLYLGTGSSSKAEKAARDALKAAEGKSIPAKLYNILSRISLQKGDAKAAIEYATLAKGAYEKNQVGIKDQLEAIVLEGRANIQLQDFSSAEILLSWASEIKPDSAYIINLQGYLYEQWAASENDAAKKAELRSRASAHYLKSASRSDISAELKSIAEANGKRTAAP